MPIEPRDAFDFPWEVLGLGKAAICVYRLGAGDVRRRRRGYNDVAVEILGGGSGRAVDETPASLEGIGRKECASWAWLPMLCACAEALRLRSDDDEEDLQHLLYLITQAAKGAHLLRLMGDDDVLKTLRVFADENPKRTTAAQSVEVVLREKDEGYPRVLSALVSKTIHPSPSVAMRAFLAIALLTDLRTHPEMAVVLGKVTMRAKGGVRASHVISLSMMGSDITSFLDDPHPCVRFVAATCLDSPRAKEVLAETLDDLESLTTWWGEPRPPHYESTSPRTTSLDAAAYAHIEAGQFIESAVRYIEGLEAWTEGLGILLELEQEQLPGADLSRIRKAFMENRSLEWPVGSVADAYDVSVYRPSPAARWRRIWDQV